MPLSHFKLLHDNLALLSRSLAKSKAKDASLHSYQISRIAENLRLDFPGQRLVGHSQFRDKKGYPKGYPLDRGPNVSGEREDAFCDRLVSQLSRLNKIGKSLTSSSAAVTLKNSRIDMVGLLDEIWTIKQRRGIEETCNECNKCPPHYLPPQFRRYVALSDFLLYTLFPRIKAPEVARPEDRQEFLAQLTAERAAPGSAWNQLARWWHAIRHDIRRGRRAFRVRRKKGQRDATFFGLTEVENAAVCDPRSPEMLHKVVRELGLPGWETEERRIMKLGCVMINMEASGCCAWRPTALDLALGWSYFFVPGDPAKAHGQTWCLNKSLDRNDTSRHDGHPEWVMTFPSDGIPCQSLGPTGRPEPAFELVGLAFSPEHTALFSE